MQLVQRRAGVGYYDTHLWLPKTHVSEMQLRSSLIYDLGRDKAPLEAWSSQPEHYLVPRNYILPGALNQLPFPVYDTRLRSYPRVSIRSRVTLDAKDPSKTIQREASAALLATHDGILCLRCGAGKTATGIHSAAQLNVPVLVIVNNLGLAEQWIEEVLALTDLKEADIGFIGDGELNWQKPLVLALVQSLASQVRNGTVPAGMAEHFGVIIADECFPAGTLIDGRPIETLVVGDLVTAFDPRTQSFRKRQVVRCFKRPARALRTFYVGDTTLSCTDEHPLYTPTGWLPARQLSVGDLVALHVYNKDTKLRCMPSAIHPEVPEQQGVLPNLQPRLQVATSPREVRGYASAGGAHGGLSVVCSTSDSQFTKGEAGLLQGGDLLLCGARCAAQEAGAFCRRTGHGPQMPRAALPTYATAQPNSESGDNRKDPANQAQEWDPARGTTCTRWKRPGTHGPASEHVEVAGYRMGSGASSTHGEEAPVSNIICYRSCSSSEDACCRDRREQPLQQEGTGSTEGGTLTWRRVDRLEIHEQGGIGRFAEVCPDGAVYNIEVEEDHTYVANGVVVHNCHCIGAPYYNTAISPFHGRRWGLSATPTRSDNFDSLLKYTTGEIVYSYLLPELIPKVYFRRVNTRVNSMDPAVFEATTDKRGEEHLGKLYGYLATVEERVRIIAIETMNAVSRGREVLVLSQSRAMVEALGALIPGAGVIHGGVTDRKERLRRIRNCNPVIAIAKLGKEALNKPTLDTLQVCEPFSDRDVLQQIMGRVLRACVGKQAPVVVFYDDVLIDVMTHMCAGIKRKLSRWPDAMGGRIPFQVA